MILILQTKVNIKTWISNVQNQFIVYNENVHIFDSLNIYIDMM